MVCLVGSECDILHALAIIIGSSGTYSFDRSIVSPSADATAADVDCSEHELTAAGSLEVGQICGLAKAGCMIRWLLCLPIRRTFFSFE